MRFLLLICGLVAAAQCSTVPAVVNIQNNVITGVVNNGVSTFLGIIYAAGVRFAPPKFTPVNRDIQATSFSAICPQVDSSGNIVGDENCLSLNIWVPDTATPSSNLPVLVWIYGGGFVNGFSSYPLYDLQSIARQSGYSNQDVVVVSLNYRVGPFGFFSESSTTGGNWGLLDQIAALQWVAKYIAYFGGNPKKVTLFGQSAGGLSVCYLVNSGLATGLFGAAVIDAGNCGAPLRDVAAQQTLSAHLTNAVGCQNAGSPSDVLACLRAQTMVQIMNANIAIGGSQIFGKYGVPLWEPFLDGILLQTQPLLNFRSGNFPNAVPLLMGSTTGSMSVFVQGNPYLTTTNQTQLDNLISLYSTPLTSSSLLNANAFPAIQAYYSDVSNFDGDYIKAGISFLSDGIFVCGSKMESGMFAQSGVTAYYWVWNHTIECVSLQVQGVCTSLAAQYGSFAPYMGAFHGSDLGFWFNTSYFGDAQELELSVQMQQILLSFVNTQIPSAPVSWQPITNYYDPMPLFLQENMVVAEFNTYPCSLWENLYEYTPSLVYLPSNPTSAYSRYYDIAIAVACAFVASLIGVVAYFAYQGHVIIMRKRNGVALLNRVPSYH